MVATKALRVLRSKSMWFGFHPKRIPFSTSRLHTLWSVSLLALWQFR